MAMEGITFFLFQPLISSGNRSEREMGRHPPFTKRSLGGFVDSRRTSLTRRLFQISDMVWKVCLDDEGPKMILEKGLTENNRRQIANCRRQIAGGR
jgi:hypothetical protein